MMFIDCEDGSTIMICDGRNVLEAGKLAQEKRGRLRLVVSNSMATNDPMVGCVELGDWRPPKALTPYS